MDGYSKLGVVGFTSKGAYDPTKTYNMFNTVLSSGSTYVALKDNLSGVTPSDDGVNWRLMAAGSPIFNGTTAKWNALSSQAKAEYTVVILTDD